MNVNSPGLETDFRNWINRLKTETKNKIKNEIRKNWEPVNKIETKYYSATLHNIKHLCYTGHFV